MADHNSDGSMLSAFLTISALFLNVFNYLKGDSVSLFVGICVGVAAFANHAFSFYLKYKSYRDGRKGNNETK